MPGGPVNGASNLARTDVKSVIVPTVLQLASDALDYWMNMTCLYDPCWVAEEGKATLPICMFHVKKIVPTRTVEVSRKRVILYEPQFDGRETSAKFAGQMREGIMQTIVDNAVKQPVTYNMELIVPFQPIGRYVKEGVKGIADMMVGLFQLVGQEEEVASGIGSIFAGTSAVLKIINQVASVAEKFPGSDGVTYLNMNSLEAMADSCRLLCMKMWTGYDYKYVMITGMTSDKQPLEDDVFRVTLNLQEMPVLSVTKPAPPLAPSEISRNWVASAVSAMQEALVTPLVAFTGVKAASRDENSNGIAEDAGGNYEVNLNRGFIPE